MYLQIFLKFWYICNYDIFYKFWVTQWVKWKSECSQNIKESRPWKKNRFQMTLMNCSTSVLHWYSQILLTFLHAWVCMNFSVTKKGALNFFDALISMIMIRINSGLSVTQNFITAFQNVHISWIRSSDFIWTWNKNTGIVVSL